MRVVVGDASLQFLEKVGDRFVAFTNCGKPKQALVLIRWAEQALAPDHSSRGSPAAAAAKQPFAHNCWEARGGGVVLRDEDAANEYASHC